MTPYTYLIGWTDHNIWYYGCQHGPKAHPSNLWTTYFTSSKLVKHYRKDYGEPDVVEVRRTFGSAQIALKWEHEVLRRMNAIRQEKWLNQSYGGTKFYRSGPHSEKTKAKMRGREVTEVTKARMRKAAVGKPPISPKTREKLSLAGRGLIRSSETREKMRTSALRRGPRTTETKENMRQGTTKAWQRRECRKQSPEQREKRRSAALKLLEYRGQIYIGFKDLKDKTGLSRYKYLKMAGKRKIRS